MLARRGRLLRPHAAAFDPLSIPWFIASWAAEEAYADGASVTQATDHSGNGRHRTQATAAKQPVFDTAHPSFNNKPVYVFDGVDDHLDSPSWTVLTGITTHVIVGRANNLATNNTFHHAIVSSGVNGVLILSTNVYRLFSGTSLDGGTATTDARLFVAQFNTAGDDSLKVDGALAISGNAGTQGCGSSRIGANAGLNNFLSGAIAFSAIINRALTAQEEADLRAWSQAEYATP